MPRIKMFLLWMTLGVYAVGVIAVVLAALLFTSTGDHNLDYSNPPGDRPSE